MSGDPNPKGAETAERGALVAELRRALAEEEHRKSVFAAPYSGYDAAQNFHEARGYTRGIARAIETLDALSGSGASRG